ncbi:ParB/RepB/Spo0J family partition protein [Deltaproteobacteria bacterium TL4]
MLQLSLEQIHPNPQQPRKHFDEETLQGLARSIQSQGIIQPLVVRKSLIHPDHYELVTGERRWRALHLTDISTVPCVCKTISDHELLEVALLENIQRENLTPIEEASSYQQLLQTHGYTHEQLARRLGKNRTTLTNMMRLLQLPDAIQNDLEEGRLTGGHARALLALPTAEEQLRMRTLILKHTWSVRETEKQVRSQLTHLEPHRQQKSSSEAEQPTRQELNLELKNLESEMQRHLGTKVTLKYHRGKGSITIEYYSLDEFERIQAILLGKKKAFH